MIVRKQTDKVKIVTCNRQCAKIKFVAVQHFLKSAPPAVSHSVYNSEQGEKHTDEQQRQKGTGTEGM